MSSFRTMSASPPRGMGADLRWVAMEFLPGELQNYIHKPTKDKLLDSGFRSQ
jgi:hypothetical protein